MWRLVAHRDPKIRHAMRGTTKWAEWVDGSGSRFAITTTRTAETRAEFCGADDTPKKKSMIAKTKELRSQWRVIAHFST